MWCIPTVLSSLRIIAGLALIPLIWSGAFALAFGVFVFAYVTDLVDGPLARKLGVASREGELIDLWADVTFDALAVLTLMFANIVPSMYGVPLIATIYIIRLPGFLNRKHGFVLVAANVFLVGWTIGMACIALIYAKLAFGEDGLPTVLGASAVIGLAVAYLKRERIARDIATGFREAFGRHP